MAIRIRLRRDTASNWTSANTVLDEGELGLETDTSKFKIGDGTTAWTSLAYQGVPSGTIDVSSIEKGGIVVGTSSGNVAILPVGADGTVLGVDTSDPTTVGWVSLNLNALSDATITSATSGDLLQYNGSVWVNKPIADLLTENRSSLTPLVWGASSGYFSRGDATNVYKWAFPSDTVTTTTSAPDYMYRHSGFSNPSVAGYFSQGDSLANIFKWGLAGDVVTTTSSSPASLEDHAGFENPAVAGYFSRGVSSSNFNVYKWSFPSDTASSTTSSTLYLYRNAGFSNPSVAGYFCQGDFSTAVRKWSFPADTVSTTTSASSDMYDNAGFANASVAGYFCKGNSDTAVFKWAFPSDTVSTTTSSYTGMRYNAGFENPTVAGYFSHSKNTNYVTKWLFPSDTVIETTSSPAVMNDHAGFGNGY